MSKSVIQNFGESQQSFPFVVVIGKDAEGKEEKSDRMITIPSAHQGQPGTSRTLDPDEIAALKAPKNKVFNMLLEQSDNGGLRIIESVIPQQPSSPVAKTVGLDATEKADLVETITAQVLKIIQPKLDEVLGELDHKLTEVKGLLEKTQVSEKNAKASFDAVKIKTSDAENFAKDAEKSASKAKSQADEVKKLAKSS